MSENTPETAAVNVPAPSRLASLDILRGFDMFFLIALHGILLSLFSVWDLTRENSWIVKQLWHKNWEGFAVWDMVMPLFIFLAGVSIPLAVRAHRRKGWSTLDLFARLMRRVVILWVLGMIAQGNLLALNFDRIYLFSNTLQSIAVGALIATPIIFFTRRFSTRLVITLALMAAYTLFMQFGTFDGMGSGSYAPGNNFAEALDRFVLGRFTDGASLQNGVVRFAPYYHYTWILSSLNFGALTLCGALGGSLLINDEWSGNKRTLAILGTALGFAAVAGLIYVCGEPIIKTIFTSSMTAMTGAIALALLALFYYVIDVRGYSFGLNWLKVIGSNALLAYMLSAEVGVFQVGILGNKVFFGLQQYVGDYYAVILCIVNFALIYALLFLLKRQKIFLRA